jgi:virginiamycin B lyase
MRVLLALGVTVALAPLHVVATVATPARPIGVAYGSGAVWTASFDFGGVLRIDPKTNRITARIKTGRGPIGVTYGAGSVWVANWLEDTVARVDPNSGKVVARIHVGAHGPEGMAFGAGARGCQTKPAASPGSTRRRTARWR